MAAPPPGLAKPRLVKVKKHFVSHQGRSTQVDSGFNPFRSVSDDSRVQVLSDQWRNRNHFPSDSAQNCKGSTITDASVSGHFESGKSEDTCFVFGASGRSSASNSKTSGLSESVGKSLADEMKKSDIGSGREFQSAKEGSFNTRAKVNLRSSEVSGKSVFAFGSSSKKSAGLDGSTTFKRQDETRKMEMESSGDADSVVRIEDPYVGCEANDTNPFVFEIWNNVASSFARNSVETTKKLDIEDSVNIASVGYSISSNADKKSTFVFGSSKDAATSMGQISAAMLPNDEVRNNVEGFGNGGVENTGGSFGGVEISGRPSTDFYVNDWQNGNSADNIFLDPTVSGSIPTPWIQGKSLGVPPFQQTNHSELKETSVPASSLSSACPGFHTVGNSFEGPYIDMAEKKAGFSFTRTNGLGKLHIDLKTPKQDASCSSTGNLFPGLSRKFEFSAKRGVKNTRLKKRRGKLRQSAPVHINSVSRKNSSQENSESPGCSSPMDFSPYHETLAAGQCLRETAVALDEPFHLDTNCASADAHPSVFIDVTYEEHLVTLTHSLDINEDDTKCRELNGEVSEYQFEKGVGAKCPLKELFFGTETECLRSKTEKLDTNSDTSVAATEAECGFCSNTEKQGSNGRTQFCFSPSLECDINFTFAASSSAQGHLSTPKRHYRKKNRTKVAQDSHSSTSNAKIQLASPTVQVFPLASNSSFSVPGHVKKGNSSISQSKGMSRFDGDKEPEVKQGTIFTGITSAAIQEACEKWRLRGNQAFAKGNLSKAEDYYTCGVNCVSSTEISKRCIRALVLCYSNRAATRMSLGRMREALEDCKMAGAIDHNFLKVQVRAGNCHLALGEIEDALKYFKKCLESGSDVCLDQKIVIEASDGLKKAQKVAEYVNRCAELLQQRTSNDAESALRIIAEALSISPYSEKLVEMKAEALLMLRKYEEVVQLCDQRLDSADKSSASINADGQLENLDGYKNKNNTPARFWCLYLISKAYFYLGRLEDSLEKLEQLGPVTENCGSKTQESFISFTITVRGLLHQKAAGNEAFQSGRHLEAVEHYTAALTLSVDSHPFAAICFCNRAAAHQALGQITDAIADCSLAIALDRNYAKAISRRATLHEMIRDYRKAASDLQRLVSLLEKRREDTAKQSCILSSSTSIANDLRQAYLRLATMEEETRKEIPLNMYLILGIEPSAMASYIKKAYHKAALRHHPDKAGQFLARSENVDSGLWKEITEEVHKEADRLFKMIGEAYAVLSDSAKRSQYNLEEEMRNAQKKNNGCIASKLSDDNSYPFERSGRRRQWQKW